MSAWSSGHEHRKPVNIECCRAKFGIDRARDYLNALLEARNGDGRQPRWRSLVTLDYPIELRLRDGDAGELLL